MWQWTKNTKKNTTHQNLLGSHTTTFGLDKTAYALIRPCLGLFPFLPTSLSSIFLTTLLLLFLCLLLPLASPSLFPCARYPCSPCYMVSSIDYRPLYHTRRVLYHRRFIENSYTVFLFVLVRIALQADPTWQALP